MKANKKRIAIRDNRDMVIGVFEFDVAHYAPERIVSLMEHIQGIATLLVETNIAPDGTATGKDALIIRKAERQLYQEIDKVFGKSVGKMLFSKRHPFACVGGKFWAARLLPEVIEQIGGNNAKAD